MDLSIIIPVYEEKQKIGTDIKSAEELIRNHFTSGEIVVVDDGSRDGTIDVIRQTNVQPPVVMTGLAYSDHRGKGFAVRTGIAHSRGHYVIFADSGSCIPYENSLRGLALIRNHKCDIAHGSRRLPESHIVHPHRFLRRLTAILFHYSINISMGIPSTLTDTQCGFKVYKGDIARNIYKDCMTDGFMFDIEIIMRALKQGYRIKEFPVEWTADIDSRLKLLKIPLAMIKELSSIKRLFQ